MIFEDQMPKRLKFYTHIDCFCGSGIGAIGSDLAGFETIFAFDNDKRAIETYNKNHTPVGKVIDANDLDINSLPEADVISGGFPCKPFSIIGKQLGQNDPKTGNLALTMCKIILLKNLNVF